MKAFLTMLHGAFSDISYNIDVMMSEGDKVCWRWSMGAMHTGNFMGMPATGRNITITDISIIRVQDGMFVEH